MISPVFHSQFSEQVLCQPLLKFSNFDLMSIPDNMSDKDLQSWKSNAQKTEKVSSAKTEFYKEEIALKGGGRADTMSQIFTDTIQVGKSQGYGESPYSTIKESIVEILTRL